MRHLKLKKEIDHYLAVRCSRKKSPQQKPNTFKKQYEERHISIPDNELRAMEEGSGNSVIVVDSHKNFFQVLHDWLMGFLRKS